MPEIRTVIVGARFRGEEAVKAVAALREQDEIELRREADNKHDPNAVACYRDGQALGYIPARQNGDLARALDQGATATAVVLDPEQGRDPPRIIVRWEHSDAE